MTTPIAVAWDIDGTLVDSEPVHLAALVAVSARYGLDLSNDPEDRFLGQHLGSVWAELSPHYPVDLLQSRWVEEILGEYALRSHELKVVTVMLATMGELHKRGVMQVCVSNSERAIVDANIGVLGIGEMIGFSISREDVATPKPDPEPYRLAARRLGLPPSSMLAVEDSETGARSAIGAGLSVIRYQPAREQEAAAEILALFRGTGMDMTGKHLLSE